MPIIFDYLCPALVKALKVIFFALMALCLDGIKAGAFTELALIHVLT